MVSIHGDTDDRTRMILGQIREVFEPVWIQGFGDDNGFTVQFSDEPDSDEALRRFVQMHGYELEKYEDENWNRYYFE